MCLLSLSTTPDSTISPFCFHSYGHPPALHSFPTRRSSDLSPALIASSMRLSAIRSNLLIASSISWSIFRSEEHTSELQSRFDLVCRLLLEKKKLAKHYAALCLAEALSAPRFAYGFLDSDRV